MDGVSWAVGLTGVVLIALSMREILRNDSTERAISLALALFASAAVLNQTWIGYRSVILATGLACIAASGLVIVIRWDDLKQSTIRGRHMWFLWLGLWLFLVDAVTSPSPSVIEVFSRLLPIAVLASMLPLCTSPFLSLRSAVSAVLSGFGVACVLTLAAPTTWTTCLEFKCGPFGELFTGPFASGNYFGAAAGAAVVTALTLEKCWLKYLTLGAAGFILIASDARTSQVALAVALLVYFLARRSSRPHPVLGAVTTALLVVIGTRMVYTSDLSSFSNRGIIWELGTRAIGSEWIFGKGLSTWTPEVLARNYMHSQQLFLLYSGGAVALVLYVVLIATVLGNAPRSVNALAWATATLILVGGLTEVVWNPLAFDGTTFLILPLVLSGTVSMEVPGPPKPAEQLRKSPKSQGGSASARRRLVPRSRTRRSR
jgi:hypothetical protein